jgi:hypothetical protein
MEPDVSASTQNPAIIINRQQKHEAFKIMRGFIQGDVKFLTRGIMSRGRRIVSRSIYEEGLRLHVACMEGF